MAKLYMGLSYMDLLMLPEAAISLWICIKKWHRYLKLKITFSSLASLSLTVWLRFCLPLSLAQINLWQKDWKTRETFLFILVNVTKFPFSKNGWDYLKLLKELYLSSIQHYSWELLKEAVFSTNCKPLFSSSQTAKLGLQKWAMTWGNLSNELL